MDNTSYLALCTALNQTVPTLLTQAMVERERACMQREDLASRLNELPVLFMINDSETSSNSENNEESTDDDTPAASP
jgi:hypothetical protein